MNDMQLKMLVWELGYKEGMPVVINPGIMKPEEFLNDVLTKRLPNPFMPDTPQRIATDTSQKLPVRFGQTLKAYTLKQGVKPSQLTMIPLVFAG
jgi:fructuronate reductase